MAVRTFCRVRHAAPGGRSGGPVLFSDHLALQRDRSPSLARVLTADQPDQVGELAACTGVTSARQRVGSDFAGHAHEIITFVALSGNHTFPVHHHRSGVRASNDLAVTGSYQTVHVIQRLRQGDCADPGGSTG